MPTVFRCVASRNKRAHRAFYWLCLPQLEAEAGRLFEIEALRVEATIGAEATRFACRAAAPGHRGYGSGSVWVVGNGGYSWTLTVSDIYGVYLYFDATGLGSNYPVHRASGLQLRCLSE